jgi:hypothetical protein
MGGRESTARWKPFTDVARRWMPPMHACVSCCDGLTTSPVDWAGPRLAAPRRGRKAPAACTARYCERCFFSNVSLTRRRNAVSAGRCAADGDEMGLSEGSSRDDFAIGAWHSTPSAPVSAICRRRKAANSRGHCPGRSAYSCCKQAPIPTHSAFASSPVMATRNPSLRIDNSQRSWSAKTVKGALATFMGRAPALNFVVVTEVWSSM